VLHSPDKYFLKYIKKEKTINHIAFLFLKFFKKEKDGTKIGQMARGSISHKRTYAVMYRSSSG
jgi:hypothetical protein